MRLEPEALLSLPVFAFSFFWAIVVHFTDIANNGIDHVFLRLTALLAVQVLFFAFPFLMWHVVCPRVNQRLWIRLLMLGIVVGALVRGAVFAFLLYSLSLTATPQYVFRSLTSLVNMAAVTILAWLVVSEIRSLQLRRRLLLVERDQLIILQESAQEDLDRLGDRASTEIRALVTASVGDQEAVTSGDLLERLRRTVDEVVRPISRELAGRGTSWAPPEIVLSQTRVNWRLAISHGLAPSRIHPLAVTLGLIWLAIPVHLVQYGPRYALGAISTGIVGFPAFWLARRAAIAVSRGCGSSVRILSFIIAVLIGGGAMGGASLAYMRGQDQPFIFVIMVPIFALLISAPLAIAEDARDQGLAVEAELEATTVNLRWTLARTRERHRQQEVALAHALHGRVQAALEAAIVRLELAAAQGVDDATLVEVLHEEVLDVIGGLDSASATPESLTQVVSLTQRNWVGALEISLSSSTDVDELLEADALCARAVNDLIPELVFNGFRHGKATRVDVRLALMEPRILELVVSDNGSLDPRSVRQGMGSQLLDAASISWSRTSHAAGTSTACLLPCLPLEGK